MTYMDLNQLMTLRNSCAWVDARIKHWTNFSKNLERSQVKPMVTQEASKGCQLQPCKKKSGLVSLQKVASFQGGKGGRKFL